MDRSNSLDTLKRLLDAKKDITKSLYMHQDCLKSLRKLHSSVPSSPNSSQELYTVDTILQNASCISYAAHAPKEYFVGMKLLNYHPPAPQAEEMRDGMLQKYYLRLRRNKKLLHNNSVVSMIDPSSTEQMASTASISSRQDHGMDQQSFVDHLKSQLASRRTTDIHSTSSTAVMSRKVKPMNTINIDGKSMFREADDELKAEPINVLSEQDRIIGLKRSRTVNLAFTYSDDDDDDDDDSDE